MRRQETIPFQYQDKVPEGKRLWWRMHAYLVLGIDLGLCRNQQLHHLNITTPGSTKQRRVPNLREQRQEESERVVESCAFKKVCNQAWLLAAGKSLDMWLNAYMCELQMAFCFKQRLDDYGELFKITPFHTLVFITKRHYI